MPTIHFEPETPVPSCRGFDALDQQLAFIGRVGGKDQTSVGKGKTRDTLH
jgi:hypothetical protein